MAAKKQWDGYSKPRRTKKCSCNRAGKPKGGVKNRSKRYVGSKGVPPYRIVNTRTHARSHVRKTFHGAVTEWYRLGGRAAGWRIRDSNGDSVPAAP